MSYIGVDTDNGDLEKEIVQSVFEKNNVKIENLPAGVYMNWRDGFWTAVNYSSSSVQIPVSKNSNIIIGSQPLAPAGVLIWK